MLGLVLLLTLRGPSLYWQAAAVLMTVPSGLHGFHLDVDMHLPVLLSVASHLNGICCVIWSN